MVSGSTADRVGRRKIFRLGLTLFSLGSLLCSLAPSAAALVAFRALQGVGGSMLNPVAMSIVRNVFDSMAEALHRGDHVELRGFGSFGVRDHGAYRGRNPRSGGAVEVPPRRSPFFKIGKPLRARIEGVDGGEGQAAAPSAPLAASSDAE